jgi:hypothetical protein
MLTKREALHLMEQIRSLSKQLKVMKTLTVADVSIVTKTLDNWDESFKKVKLVDTTHTFTRTCKECKRKKPVIEFNFVKYKCDQCTNEKTALIIPLMSDIIGSKSLSKVSRDLRGEHRQLVDYIAD